MTDSAVFFIGLAALCVLMCLVIWKWNLLEVSYSKPPENGKLALMSPLLGFLIFLSVCAFVPAAVSKVIQYGDTHGYAIFSQKEAENVSQLSALIVASVLLIGFSCIHPDGVRARIWGSESIVKPFLKGMLYCLIAYPIVLTIVQGIHLVVDWFGMKPIHEQVALQQLKNLKSNPWLFWSFAVSIVTLVPLVEEFLFRGLIQNYFGNFFGPKLTIILTSLLFASFHYSPLQGATNIELLVGLFIYSYFIGIFYMRERTLWTPIAMHATFNALTIFIMFFVI
jgi:membrane protease YdiL (CAAX protease family)